MPDDSRIAIGWTRLCTQRGVTIAGSRSVQVSQFDPESKLLANAKELPVVAVCRTGQASADAAKRLKKAGFEQVYWLDGGVQAWQQADLPLIKGRG